MEIFSKNDILVKRLFDINGRLLKTSFTSGKLWFFRLRKP